MYTHPEEIKLIDPVIGLKAEFLTLLDEQERVGEDYFEF